MTWRRTLTGSRSFTQKSQTLKKIVLQLSAFDDQYSSFCLVVPEIQVNPLPTLLLRIGPTMPGHLPTQCRIAHQTFNATQEIRSISCLGYQPGAPVLNDFFRPSSIRNDDRHARCHRFQNDVAEGVGRAWK